MSTIRTYALAAAGVLLATVTATPAAACIDWGYSGIVTYGWPYAATGVSNPPVLKYRSCGGIYNISGWGECGGYGRCGWEPFDPVVLQAPVTDMPPTSPGERLAAGQPAVIRAARKTRRHTAPADAAPGLSTSPSISPSTSPVTTPGDGKL